MFGRKCSLCGGRLNMQNVCKECGLDNTKSDKYYKINRSDCDNMPLTHVHEEKPRKEKQAEKGKVTYTYNTKQTGKTVRKQPKDKKKGTAVAALIPLLAVFISVCTSLTGLIWDEEGDFSWEEETYFEETDPYENLINTLPEDGEYMEYVLESGEYIVGLHIPAGYYQASAADDFDVIEVVDPENEIHLYKSNGSIYMDDLRLFDGALLKVATSGSVVLITENAQMQSMDTLIENSVKDNLWITEEEETKAGFDFKAGVYDVYASGDYVEVILNTVDGFGDESMVRILGLGDTGEYGYCYKNLVIPERAVISSKGGDLELVPSSTVSNMDYEDYYDRYNY